MPKSRTYLDANVLMAAWQGQGDVAQQAMQILDNPEREFVVSDALWLELMPKPLYHKQNDEADFYNALFEEADNIPWQVDVLNKACEVATKYGIAAMDAIHVAIALAAGADEFVSGEKPTKPMFRVREIRMTSLREPVVVGE